MLHRSLNIAPLADFAVMPPRAVAELPRFALRRADRAHRRGTGDAMWWEQVWINAEIAIERRLSSCA